MSEGIPSPCGSGLLYKIALVSGLTKGNSRQSSWIASG